MPWLLFNIARIQHKLDRLEQAVSTYNRFLSSSTSDADAPLRDKATQYVQQIEAELHARRQPITDLAAPATPPPPPSIYKRWWLWTVVGLAAAGVATGIGLGVAARAPDTSGWTVYQPFMP